MYEILFFFFSKMKKAIETEKRFQKMRQGYN